MTGIARRDFLKIGAGALGANALIRLPLSARTETSADDDGRAKIYTVFFNIAPSTDDSDLLPMSNEQIMDRLKGACPGVDFVVRDLTKSTTLSEVLNEMKELKKRDYDGVIVYGWPRDYEVLQSGLPTINISVINDFMNVPVKIYPQNRVVAAFLDPWRFSRSEKIGEAMFTDLVDKIKLIKALKKLKKATILTVTDSPLVNVIYGDTLKYPPADYNERFLAALEDLFEVRVKKIDGNQVCENPEIKKIWFEKNDRAREIAAMWIRDAVKMINTIESEVVKSAKCYLAMKTLMHQYGAAAMAFHIRYLEKNAAPEDHVYPALATSEFQKEGSVAKCQSHLNIILSEMVLQFAYGIPSMLGDFEIDPYNNTSIVQHCEGPWNPWGDRRRVPYIVTDHRERLVRGRAKPGVGAASWVLYPADEPVTFWQLDVLRRELLVHTGKTIPIDTEESLYKNHFWGMM